MNTFIRADNIRQANQLRTIEIIRHYTKHAEGAVLVKFGDTHVLCTASVEEKVPGFLKGKNQGWVTAEYGMLPRSTGSRMDREAARGKQSGRTQEIQRLIGRSLRAIIDLEKLGERSVHIDCDVIQADGGTRTASITGAPSKASQHKPESSASAGKPVARLAWRALARAFSMNVQCGSAASVILKLDCGSTSILSGCNKV